LVPVDHPCLLVAPLHVLRSTFLLVLTDSTATVIYPLSLHDALPIWDLLLPLRHAPARHAGVGGGAGRLLSPAGAPRRGARPPPTDRKSTRLNSSHQITSYAAFCLKKKMQPPPVLTAEVDSRTTHREP